ncbi:MAG: hypothetical protein HQK76_06835 [Desulfobacterales bacterium]|nr:hypothetical protein [Desulfobacterales bacterium]
MKKLFLHTFVFIFTLFVISCAVTKPVVEEEDRINSEGKPVTFPHYNGPKIPLAVIPMGLSERAAKQYPRLLEQSVGLGVHNVLTDALFKTHRFRFVEDNEAIIENALKRQWMSASGAVDQNSAVQMGKILGAKKVIYGEVYDYSEGKEENISGFKVSTKPEIRVGIQIRLVDVETLEYIPASDVKYSTDWGKASAASIEGAVFKLIQNLE